MNHLLLVIDAPLSPIHPHQIYLDGMISQLCVNGWRVSVVALSPDAGLLDHYLNFDPPTHIHLVALSLAAIKAGRLFHNAGLHFSTGCLSLQVKGIPSKKFTRLSKFVSKLMLQQVNKHSTKCIAPDEDTADVLRTMLIPCVVAPPIINQDVFKFRARDVVSDKLKLLMPIINGKDDIVEFLRLENPLRKLCVVSTTPVPTEILSHSDNSSMFIVPIDNKGHESLEALARLCAWADAVIVPRRSGTLADSMVSLCAMAVGTPSVGLRDGDGCISHIRNGVNGALGNSLISGLWEAAQLDRERIALSTLEYTTITNSFNFCEHLVPV